MVSTTFAINSKNINFCLNTYNNYVYCKRILRLTFYMLIKTMRSTSGKLIGNYLITPEILSICNSQLHLHYTFFGWEKATGLLLYTLALMQFFL